MADEADRGNEAAELFLDAAMKNRKQAVIPAGIGMCLNCGEDVEGENRWCDNDCRQDWEKRNKNK